MADIGVRGLDLDVVAAVLPYRASNFVEKVFEAALRWHRALDGDVEVDELTLPCVHSAHILERRAEIFEHKQKLRQSIIRLLDAARCVTKLGRHRN